MRVNDKYVEIFVLLESFKDEKSTMKNEEENYLMKIQFLENEH